MLCKLNHESVPVFVKKKTFLRLQDIVLVFIMRVSRHALTQCPFQNYIERVEYLRKQITLITSIIVSRLNDNSSSTSIYFYIAKSAG